MPMTPLSSHSKREPLTPLTATELSVNETYATQELSLWVEALNTS